MLEAKEWLARPLLPGFIALTLGLLSVWNPWLLLGIPVMLALFRDAKVWGAVLVMAASGWWLRPLPGVPVTESRLFHGEAVVTTVPRDMRTALIAEAKIQEGRVILRLPPHAEASLGDRLLIQGGMRSPRPSQARSGFIAEIKSSFAPQVLTHGPAVWRWGHWIRRSFEGFLAASVPARQAPLVDALCFGVTSGMSDEDLELIRKSGGAHLIAASGANVAFLLVLVWAGIKWIPLPLWLRSMALAFVLIVYAGAAGLNPPIVRAVIMAVIMGGALLAEKEPDLLNALCGAGILSLLMNGWEVISPSFWLSFAAVAGLVLFARGSASLFLSTLYASLAASLATAPLVGYWFGSIPMAGIIVTLLTGPLALILMALSLGTWVVWLLIPALGRLLGVLSEGLASWMLLVFIQFGGPWQVSLQVPEFSPWWLAPFYLLGLLIAPGTKEREGRAAAAPPSY